MKRYVAIALTIVVSAVSAVNASSDNPSVVRVGVKPALEAGPHQVVLTVYATREGGTPLASEARTVQVDANGAFTAPLGNLSLLASSRGEERWLGMQVMPRAEAPRVKLEGKGRLPVTVNVVTDAAITANGFVESIAQGFRFPDGSVQISAATVSGGVPSVNGIGSAVTIQGAATVSVGTAASTITITGPSFGSPVAVSSANADGVANTVARSDHVHAHGTQVGVRTILVSPVVGNATASGTALTTALTGISGATSSNPYLLRIEPGVYNIGNAALTMQSYVDIEGSGQNATFITATRGSVSIGAAAAAVIGAANSEIRNLSITNTSSSSYGFGFFSSGSGTRRISNVTITSTGGAVVSGGIYGDGSTIVAFRATVTAIGVGGASDTWGFFSTGTGITGSTINILNSTVRASGTIGTGNNLAVTTTAGASPCSCVVTIDGSTIVASGFTSSANYGVYASFGTANVTNSTVRVDTAGTRQAVRTNATSDSIINVFHSSLIAGNSTNSLAVSISKGATSTVRVATSQVDSSALGTPNCVYNFDSSLNALGTSCPAPTS